MKNCIYILFLLFNNSIFAQVRYFSDTLSHTPTAIFPYGGVILDRGDSTYSIIEKTSNVIGLSIIKTDRNNNFSSSKQWGIRNGINVSGTGYFNVMLPSKNWIVPLWAWSNHTTFSRFYNAFFKMSPKLDDTLLSKIYLHRYNNDTTTSSALGGVYLNKDSASFWAIGGYLTDVYASPMFVSRIDTNFNILSELNIFSGSNTKTYSSRSSLPRANNRCIVTGIISPSLGYSQDDIKICGIDDNGVRWSKIYGGLNKRDDCTFLFNGPTDTTFWLVYTEGRIDTVGSGSGTPATRVRIVLLTDNGQELMTRYLGHTQWIFTYHQIALPLADGGYLFGFYKTDYHAIFQKYSANFELQWESEPPFPNMPSNYPYINPLHAAELPNGDFISTGVFDDGVSPSYMIWLGKMDSTGCWYDTGCSPTAESPPLGDLGGVRVYPNPAHDILNIAIADFQNKKVIITNTLGIEQKIIPLQSENTSISTENLSNGTYIIHIRGENTYFTQKVIILK